MAANMNENESEVIIICQVVNELIENDQGQNLIMELMKENREEEVVMEAVASYLTNNKNTAVRIPCYYELVVPQ